MIFQARFHCSTMRTVKLFILLFIWYAAHKVFGQIKINSTELVQKKRTNGLIQSTSISELKNRNEIHTQPSDVLMLMDCSISVRNKGTPVLFLKC